MDLSKSTHIPFWLGMGKESEMGQPCGTGEGKGTSSWAEQWKHSVLYLLGKCSERRVHLGRREGKLVQMELEREMESGGAGERH